MLPKPLIAAQWAYLGFAWSKGKGKIDYLLDEYKKAFWEFGGPDYKGKKGAMSPYRLMGGSRLLRGLGVRG
jgi:hypothetical protein